MSKRVCSVDGCEKVHNARGLCAMHQYRLEVTGNLDKKPTLSISEKLCNVDGCSNIRTAHGLCMTHICRLKRTGNLHKLNPIEQLRKTLLQRVSITNNGCWEYIKRRTRDGYGRLGFNGQQILAHRASYLVHFGEFDQSLCICHTCDNPPCVNPEHLFIGTHKDNMIDAAKKRRMGRRFKSGRSKLSEDAAKAILADPRPYRVIARDYEINHGSIRAIKLGKSWSWLQGE